MFDTKSSLMLRISKLVSNFFNPTTSLIVYFIHLSTKNYSFLEAVQRFLPIFLIIILPISIWTFWNVKKGNYSNMDVSDRNQRKSLYFFIEAAIFIYLLFNYFKTSGIDWLVLFLLILLLAMQFSNYFIKSSMHTAFNIFVAALFFSQSLTLGFIWLGITILVAISRIILKRHSPKEVIIGAIIASLVSFIYLYTNIQIHHL